MVTQRKICQEIVLRSGDYVVSLKDNQQSLFNDVQDYFEGLSDPEERLKNFIERNKGHGQIEERHAFVLRDVTFL